jgi:predicted Zn finger-like uncharacterized protein
MLIVCPSCASEYTLDPAKLGADGRTLRCAICRDTWFVAPDGKPASAGDAGGPHPETALPEPTPPPRRDRSRASKAPGGRALLLCGIAALLAASGLLLPGVFPGIVGAGDRSMLERVWRRPSDLAFRNVTSELAGQGGAAVLIVRGEIANVAAHETTLPHLEILVRNGDEQVLATWTSAAPKPKLGPGEAVRFETRMASPPPDGRQVRVHFTAAGGTAMAARSPH